VCVAPTAVSSRLAAIAWLRFTGNTATKTDGVDAKVKAAVAKARKASAANSLERRVIAVCTALETDPTFLTDVPHPQEWAARKGMTMRDMVSWYLDHAGAAGKTKVLKIAEKYLKETD
jgi:hypothetical protein